MATEWFRKTHNFEPIAVGRRVVHGGPKYCGPVVVDADVLFDLESFVSLAPLHQPNTLAPIHSICARCPSSTDCVLRDRLPPRARLSRQPLRNSGAILRRRRAALR